MTCLLFVVCGPRYVLLYKPLLFFGGWLDDERFMGCELCVMFKSVFSVERGQVCHLWKVFGIQEHDQCKECTQNPLQFFMNYWVNIVLYIENKERIICDAHVSWKQISQTNNMYTRLLPENCFQSSILCCLLSYFLCQDPSVLCFIMQIDQFIPAKEFTVSTLTFSSKIICGNQFPEDLLLKPFLQIYCLTVDIGFMGKCHFHCQSINIDFDSRILLSQH